MVQRYFINQAIQLDQPIQLTNEYYHHMIRVMRFKPDTKVELVDNAEMAYLCKIISHQQTDQTVTLEPLQLIDKQVELPIGITIACGLSKKDKIEWIVQKGTEMGATQFIFFQSRYSMVKWDNKKTDTKLERLSKIASEAAEQSHRTHQPTIRICDFESLLSVKKDFGIVAYEESAKIGETTVLEETLAKIKTQQQLITVFGPEGGFSSAEVQQLNIAGFKSAGLGPRILRAETAPLYLLAAVSYSLELAIHKGV